MSIATTTARQVTRDVATGRSKDKAPVSLVFLLLLWFSMFFGVLVLVALIVNTAIDGSTRFDSELLTNYASIVRPETSGFRAGILGSLWLMIFTAAMAVPLGIAAALYLEEFADPSTRWHRFVEVNLQNLAAVPAIVYGMLTAGFALSLGMRRGIVLVGGIALALLILPVIIITTREALRAVPAEIRQASLALGATQLQTVWRQTLPSAVPGVATGTILALSRALGEAAPLLLLGAAVFIRFDPDGLMSGFTTMPVQIFSWAGQPQVEFRELAAAAIIVLLVMLLVMNAVAIIIRNRYQRRW
jgi:phosphate transport system permease protein